MAGPARPALTTREVVLLDLVTPCGRVTAQLSRTAMQHGLRLPPARHREGPGTPPQRTETHLQPRPCGLTWLCRLPSVPRGTREACQRGVRTGASDPRETHTRPGARQVLAAGRAMPSDGLVLAELAWALRHRGHGAGGPGPGAQHRPDLLLRPLHPHRHPHRHHHDPPG